MKDEANIVEQTSGAPLTTHDIEHQLYGRRSGARASSFQSICPISSPDPIPHIPDPVPHITNPMLHTTVIEPNCG